MRNSIFDSKNLKETTFARCTRAPSISYLHEFCALEKIKFCRVSVPSLVLLLIFWASVWAFEDFSREKSLLNDWETVLNFQDPISLWEKMRQSPQKIQSILWMSKQRVKKVSLKRIPTTSEDEVKKEKICVSLGQLYPFFFLFVARDRRVLEFLGVPLQFQDELIRHGFKTQEVIISQLKRDQSNVFFKFEIVRFRFLFYWFSFKIFFTEKICESVNCESNSCSI